MKTYTTMSLLLLAALSTSCSKKMNFELGDTDGSFASGEEGAGDPR